DYFPTLQLGDCISLRGRVRVVFGEREVEVDDLNNFLVRGNGGIAPPIAHTTGAINPALVGDLVQVNARIVRIEGNEIIINDGSGEARIAIDATTGIRLPRLAPGQIVRVIGIVSRSRGRIAIFPRFASDLDFPPAPTPTRIPSTATPTEPIGARPRTATNIVARATVTRTPTLYLIARPTAFPIQPFEPLDADAFVVVGGTLTTASFVMFAVGLFALRRKK
ncbi:MAG: hypothetical protein HY070_12555, partial [Chloroflexi bacterium]|nr:hypothetical protein [Chloroflexota bacterium]